MFIPNTKYGHGMALRCELIKVYYTNCWLDTDLLVTTYLHHNENSEQLDKNFYIYYNKNK